MLAHTPYWLALLTCAVVVHGLAPGPLRNDRVRTAVFSKVSSESVSLFIPDRRLSGHVISTLDVTSALECNEVCLGVSGCSSYNYQEAGSPLHACQLSNQSKSSSPSSDYVIAAGFSYYDAEQNDGLECSCQNGGICKITESSSDLVCHCPEEYFGEKCNTWIGSDGSFSSRPGHSCFYIKKYGKDKGDGDYWIDPKRSGTPFLVKCDMTTDGGGWTLIKDITLTSSTFPSNNNFLEGSLGYTKLGSLSPNEYVALPPLSEFKDATGFQQIRFYCRKASVGRTIHIKTATNALGYDAVRYLIVNNSPFPTACGSYDRFSDDNSVLTANCNKWGRPNQNTVEANKWGHFSYTGNKRLYHKSIIWVGSVSYKFGMTNNEKKCDDNQENNLRAGDNWTIYVR